MNSFIFFILEWGKKNLFGYLMFNLQILHGKKIHISAPSPATLCVRCSGTIFIFAFVISDFIINWNFNFESMCSTWAAVCCLLLIYSTTNEFIIFIVFDAIRNELCSIGSKCRCNGKYNDFLLLFNRSFNTIPHLEPALKIIIITISVSEMEKMNGLT